MGNTPIGHIQSTLISDYSVSIPFDLLQEALTHPSYKTIEPNVKTSERLEVYGDAVLDLIVTAELFEENQNSSPGDITRKRARLVNNITLSQVGEKLHFNKALRYNPSYIPNKHDMANAVEAIFGAICFHAGFEASQDFYFHIKSVIIKAADTHPNLTKSQYFNPIGELQEFTQKNSLALPKYQVISREGPDHSPKYSISVQITLKDQTFKAQAFGISKKIAKVAAASKLLQKLENLEFS